MLRLGHPYVEREALDKVLALTKPERICSFQYSTRPRDVHIKNTSTCLNYIHPSLSSESENDFLTPLIFREPIAN